MTTREVTIELLGCKPLLTVADENRPVAEVRSEPVFPVGIDDDALTEHLDRLPRAPS